MKRQVSEGHYTKKIKKNVPAMQLSGTVGEGSGGRGMNPIWVSHASYGSPCFMFQWQIARLKNGSGIAQTICNMLLGKMLNVPRKCKTLSTVMATQWHQ